MNLKRGRPTMVVNRFKKFNLVSLFSGAGGLDLGFERHGFHTVWANDIDADACNTHKKWSDAEVVCGDITEINFKKIPQADIIAGGFPCQGFSLAGPRKIDDKRNILYRYFVKLVEEKNPLAFIAENVKGILTLGDGAIIEAIIEDFSNKGYNVFPQLVNAADYGVPQDRWRVILLGFNKDLGINEYVFPKKTLQRTSLAIALKDIEPPSNEDICRDSFSSRYMSRNRKRQWNEVAYTVPAMAKQVTLHPSSPDMIKTSEDHWIFGEGETRRFSWQEAAAIQTFPRELEFAGSLISKYKQIGNAVPVKLAEVVAEDVYVKLLESFTTKSNLKVV